jgi:hypothetical protein
MLSIVMEYWRKQRKRNLIAASLSSVFVFVLHFLCHLQVHVFKCIIPVPLKIFPFFTFLVNNVLYVPVPHVPDFIHRFSGDACAPVRSIRQLY